MAYFNGGIHDWNGPNGYVRPKPMTRLYCDPCAETEIPLPEKGTDRDPTVGRHWDTGFRWAPHYGANCHKCRFHKCRIISARRVDGGLLFAIVTSDALDYQNTKRGYRYVVFDVFGTVISRVALEDSYKTSAKATKEMWAFLNGFDAKARTLQAIDRQRKQRADDLDRLAAIVAGLKTVESPKS